MTPEDEFDRLLDHRKQGKRDDLPDDDLRKALIIADLLERSKIALPVPPDLAERIERRVQSAAQTAPRRDRLPLPPRRVWLGVVAISLVLLLTTVTFFTATAKSLPGDLLYPFKAWQQQIEIAQASKPTDRITIELMQLRQQVADLTSVVADHRSDEAIIQALDGISKQTSQTQSDIATIDSETTRQQFSRDLGDVIDEEQQTLHHLLTNISWPVRVAFSRYLGVLGESVPTITMATTTTTNSGDVVVTLTGTNFAPEVVSIINGMQSGKVTSATTKQVIFIISQNKLPRGDFFDVGIRNPGGTAASFTHVATRASSNSGHKPPTPVPAGHTPQPTPPSHEKPTPPTHNPPTSPPHHGDPK